MTGLVREPVQGCWFYRSGSGAVGAAGWVAVKRFGVGALPHGEGFEVPARELLKTCGIARPLVNALNPPLPRQSQTVVLTLRQDGRFRQPRAGQPCPQGWPDALKQDTLLSRLSELGKRLWVWENLFPLSYQNSDADNKRTSGWRELVCFWTSLQGRFRVGWNRDH